MSAQDRQATIDYLREHRWLAHQTIFANRHPETSCGAHRALVERIHSPESRYSFEGFRGLGKTTSIEEGVILRAVFGEFRYMVIVGANFRPLAVQRLAAIKTEIEVNRELIRVFGHLRGPIWQSGMIVLAGGQCIQALGRDMSVTGMKYNDTRPDALWLDDVEDPMESRTDVERKATWDWLLKTLLPSLDHPATSWVRSSGTRRGNGSLPERLENAGWPTFKVPIEHLDEDGTRRATWPAKFPLDIVDDLRHTYRADMHTYNQEYMCRAMSEESRVFHDRHIRIVPRVRTYESTYVMYDPARSIGRQSATTGKAIWSWSGAKLIVWAASAHTWMPDQLVEDIFAATAEYDPTWLTVEEDGLNEWIKQPIRFEMSRRGLVVPLKAVRAPRRKIEFIAGLRLLAEDGNLECAGDFPDLKSQLLSFPHPPIDVPNALAYAILLRPGAPIIDGFRDDHISEKLAFAPFRPAYLAVNARDQWTTAALLQFNSDRIQILADWAYEGPPEEHIESIAVDANLYATGYRYGSRPRSHNLEEALKAPDLTPVMRRAPPSWVAPDWHWDRWVNVGLVQAINRLPATPQRGGALANGRAFIDDALSRMKMGEALVQVSPAARWTLRALAGGYCRSKTGIEAETGPYRCLMEGIESWCALMTMAADEEDTEQNYSYDKSGRRYVSSIPARH